MSNTNDITNEQIKTLRQEAAQAGDDAQVAICDRALDGDEQALAVCAEVIADARAMADED